MARESAAAVPVRRILSLDGGGIRGVISAVWLARLEEELGSVLADRFDLFAGTSTGSILACAAGLGMAAKDIVQMYVANGRQVFPGDSARLWSRAKRLLSQGASAPRYDGEGLRGVLRERFGDAQFGDLAKPTLVAAYNTRAREAFVLKSHCPAHRALPLWQVVKASCSAPTYFPAQIVELDGVREPLIDGGVVANNPTACAIAEAVRLNVEQGADAGLGRLVVVSMGTGRSVRAISAKQAQEWGALEWAVPLFDVLMDGPADAVDYIARQVLPANGYFRFQTRIEAGSDDMDDASPGNINALRGLANQYLRGDGARLIQVAAALL